MKNFVQFVALLLAAALFAVSCQQEESDSYISPDALTQSSQLTSFLLRVAMAGSLDDNVLDSADCFKIKLPVEVTANGNFIVVKSESDYQQVAAIFNASNTNTDSLVLGFPITLIYTDGREMVVTSQDQLFNLQQQCPATNERPIYCAQFVYPLGISLYDAVSQTPQLSIIESGSALVDFIRSLGPQQYFEIDYPIEVVGSDGFTDTINNNAQLLAYIVQAEADCTSSCNNPNVLTDGLVLYMPFANEVSDLTGLGTPVVEGDNYSFVTDRSGNANAALSFDSTTGRIQVNSTPGNNLLQSGAFTISFWFRRQNPQVFDFEQLYNNSEMNVALGDQFNQEIRSPFVFASGMTNPVYDVGWIEGGMVGELNVWHHIVITYNSEVLYLYRDGILQSGSSAVDFTGTVMGGGTFGGNFRGHLDDIRMYKRTLTHEEINVLYQLEGDASTCMN